MCYYKYSDVSSNEKYVQNQGFKAVLKAATVPVKMSLLPQHVIILTNTFFDNYTY